MNMLGKPIMENMLRKLEIRLLINIILKLNKCIISEMEKNINSEINNQIIINELIDQNIFFF